MFSNLVPINYKLKSFNFIINWETIYFQLQIRKLVKFQIEINQNGFYKFQNGICQFKIRNNNRKA